jgi:gliding motility-associated-like protein
MMKHLSRTSLIVLIISLFVSSFTQAQLQINVILLQDVLCFGDSNGAIQVDCSSATGTVVIEFEGQQFACGEVIPGLSCGTYTVIASDDVDTVTEDISISCPAQMLFNPTVTHLQCNGFANGSIIGNVTGGTGLMTAVWTKNGNAFTTLNGTSPLNAGITGLSGGMYEITVTDANSCEITASYLVIEPEQLAQTNVLTNASCNGVCDGSIEYDITGGTSPYLVTTSDLDGNTVELDELCADDYTTIISDDNGCLILYTFTIAEPDEVTYTLDLQNESCFNDCNGSISLTNVAGGFGDFTYALSPNAGVCTPPCSGTQVEYTSMCAGIYSILITDASGCEQLVSDLELVSPAELQLILTPQIVTCNGYANGEVEITATGGTSPFNVTPGNLDVPSTVTDLGPGVYTYTITDDAGCTDTEDAIITEPTPLVSEITSTTNSSCGGNCDGIVLYTVSGGTGPYDYVLDPSGASGPVNGSITSLCSNQYELFIFDQLNCPDTLVFEITQPEPLNIDVDLNSPTCTGMFDGTAIVTVSGGTGDLTLFIEPETLDWTQLDSVTYEFINLGEGVITFQLDDEDNCTLFLTQPVVPDVATDMVLTTYNSPETCWNAADGTATVAVQNGNLPITYLWNDDYQQITPTAVGLAANITYTVIVTDNIGCTVNAEVFVGATVGCFFISTGITPNGDGVNDFWTLGGLELFPECEVTVVNRWGQEVFFSKGYDAPWDGTYKNEKLPVADYYFVIDYSDTLDPIQGTVTIKY